MARKVNPNNTTVSVKLTPGERAAIEDYRWQNRLEVSDVLRKAVTSFFVAEGVTVTEPGADAPAEGVSEVADPAETGGSDPASKRRR